MYRTLIMLVALMFMYIGTVSAQTKPDTPVEQEMDELREELEHEPDQHRDETDVQRELDRLMDKPDLMKKTRIVSLLNEREELMLEIELLRSSDCRRLLALHENLMRDHQTVMKEIETLLPNLGTDAGQKAEAERLFRVKDLLVNERVRIIEEVHLVAENLKTKISRIREIERLIADLTLPGKRLTILNKPAAPQELKAPDWGDKDNTGDKIDPSSIPKMFGACFQ